MLRVILLSLAGSIIFLGVSLPFLIAGTAGIVLAGVIVAIGAAAIWFVEEKTRSHLIEDNKWNRIMKADGENLVEPAKSDDH